MANKVKPKTKSTAKSTKSKSTKKTKQLDAKIKKHLEKMGHKKLFISLSVIFCFGVLLMFSTYAWFSTSLNVRVKTFNMIVTRNSGLSISFDAINYDTFVEISKETLINELKKTYPGNTSQWAATGLTPVSSPGITNPNDFRFDIYASSGVRYHNKKKENGFITTVLTHDSGIITYNNFIAFDLFLKNVTGSPIADNLYLDYGTGVTMDSDSGAEMQGLVNSVRIGFVKIGSLPLTTDATTIQNLKCNGNCKSVIYEPNSTYHTLLSIERATKYGINLVDGEEFPTYACVKEGGPIEVADTVSGSPNLDTNYFQIQNTMNDNDFNVPLFDIPDGVTKMRVYVWIEGQDIDSLETDSDGADISISINFIKDTKGYTSYNE